MFSSFSKSRLLALLVSLSFITTNASLWAWEGLDSFACNRLYVGAYGGGIFSNSTCVTQRGTVFFLEASGGPLAVDARGRTKETSAGLGGVQLGYEWSTCPLNIGCSGWTIAPAVETEAYWYCQTKKGHLINSSDRLPEHDFLDSFSMRADVYLANAVFSLNHCCFGAFSPYLGGGIGVTRLCIRNATSTQTSPAEPGINHFNSKRCDSSWAFAAQAKAGLRYDVCESFHIFGEYRYLFVDSSNYLFGSTVYPGHAPTSPWNVEVRHSRNNAFVFGIQYDL